MMQTISLLGALWASDPFGPVQWYLILGTAVAIAGTVRLMLTRDLMARLVAMNVVGIGSLLVLLSLGSVAEETDPVLSALVITGLVITVAFTGVGAVLIRRIEGLEDDSDRRHGGRNDAEGGGGP